MTSRNVNPSNIFFSLLEVTNEMQDRVSKLEELVNVLVSKSHSNRTDVASSRSTVDENYGSVPYSIPSPRTFDNVPPPYTVFSGMQRLNSTSNLTGITTENNDFSDSVESVESENIDQENEMDTPHYSSAVQRENEIFTRPTRPQQNISSQEREMSPVYRHLNRESFESRGRNERIRETDRGQLRSRSAHSRRQIDTYSRGRSSGNRPRETRSYPYYESRESRRVPPSGVSEQEEPLILRIGVSSQTVTDSSTSSASSSDSENEE